MNSTEFFITALNSQRYSLENEKETQIQIEQTLNELQVQFKKEYRLDGQSIIDFFVPEHGLGIEVKIKGQKGDIFRQIKRYCGFPEIRHLILLTSKSTGLPVEINSKPIYIINISKAWL